jgi:hypothetical protein
MIVSICYSNMIMKLYANENKKYFVSKKHENNYYFVLY